MKTCITLIIAAIVATTTSSAHAAGSEDVAASFAAATATTCTMTIDFVNEKSSGSTSFVYEATASVSANSQLRYTALKVNGNVITIPSGGLEALPYPKDGTMRDVNVRVTGWDNLVSASGGHTWGDSAVYSAGYTTTAETASLKLVGENPDVSVSETTVGATTGSGRYAGYGETYYYEVSRGQTIWVYLNPPDLESFVPFTPLPGTYAGGYTLELDDGTKVHLTALNGVQGFLVHVDPAAWQSGYWIIGPNGYMEWGTLDPTNIAGSRSGGSSVGIQRAEGVEVIDMRVATSGHTQLIGTIDGQVALENQWGWNAGSYVADAIALRANQWENLKIHYAGPSAWMIIREVDENGQILKNSDGTVRERLVEPNLSTGSDTYFDADLWLESGRAVLTVVPGDASSKWRPYQVTVTRSAARG